jgi:hypothetical protein
MSSKSSSSGPSSSPDKSPGPDSTLNANPGQTAPTSIMGLSTRRDELPVPQVVPRGPFDDWGGQWFGPPQEYRGAAIMHASNDPRAPCNRNKKSPRKFICRRCNTGHTTRIKYHIHMLNNHYSKRRGPQPDVPSTSAAQGEASNQLQAASAAASVKQEQSPDPDQLQALGQTSVGVSVKEEEPHDQPQALVGSAYASASVKQESHDEPQALVGAAAVSASIKQEESSNPLQVLVEAAVAEVNQRVAQLGERAPKQEADQEMEVAIEPVNNNQVANQQNESPIAPVNYRVPDLNDMPAPEEDNYRVPDLNEMPPPEDDKR